MTDNNNNTNARAIKAAADLRFRRVVDRLISHRFWRAEHFMRFHTHAIDVVEQQLDRLEGMSDEEYRRIPNVGGLLYEAIHKETFVEDEATGLVYCPAPTCKWGQYAMRQQEEEA